MSFKAAKAAEAGTLVWCLSGFAMSRGADPNYHHTFVGKQVGIFLRYEFTRTELFGFAHVLFSDGRICLVQSVDIAYVTL